MPCDEAEMQPLARALFIAAFVFTHAAVAGCGGQLQPADAEVAAAETAPTLLSFNADWSVTQSAHVVSGGKATIHYDISRLPHCRAWYHGFPAWGISASWSVDGGNTFSEPITQRNAANELVPVDITFDVGSGHDLAVWFHASDEGGCSEWDSKYSFNYHFVLDAGPGAVHFRWPGWNVELFPQLHAGQEMLVDYDIRRLPGCRQSYNGLQTWDVTVGYRFDSGTSGSASLTASPADYERIQALARITPPVEARAVEMWFENHDRTGCQAWDSAYGANYRFDVLR
ncbi:MAG: hypothetical protein JWN44_788 [Myxococcales bacterium]|nr:hypothetical protein [Myxococcales bacterium]